MWIKAKLHGGGAPTIIRVNPFLTGNGMGRLSYLRSYRAPGYKVEALRVHPRRSAKWYDEIRVDWRRWALERTVKVINSIAFSLTLMAQDGVPRKRLSSMPSAIERWWRWQRAALAKWAIRQWERWEDKVIDELYTTH